MVDEPVSIEIPPKPDYVGVVRLAIGALARAQGLDGDKVDDLRIAVSEACTHAVVANQEAGAAEPICVRWSHGDGSVTIEVEDHVGPAPEAPLEDSQGFSTRSAMAEALLSSLVDGHEVRDGENGSVRHLTLTL